MLQGNQFRQQINNVSKNYSTSYIDNLNTQMDFLQNPGLIKSKINASFDQLAYVFGDCFDGKEGFGIWKIKVGELNSTIRILKIDEDTYSIISDNEHGDELLEDIIYLELFGEE